MGLRPHRSLASSTNRAKPPVGAARLELSLELEFPYSLDILGPPEDRLMPSLETITETLDAFFKIRQLERDPAFSRFVPYVYNPIGFDWQAFFEPDFVTRFNGLMIRGAPEVSSVYCVAFPHEDILKVFLDRGTPGDLLFTHHPIDMRCGDPRGKWAEGFRAIDPSLLAQIKSRQLSVYSCHAPLDYNREISTSLSMAKALGGLVKGEFFPYGNGFAGVICSVPSISASDFAEKLKQIFGVPYLDHEGQLPESISKIALVAGGGDSVAEMQAAENAGTQAYLTGEIHSHIDTDSGRKKYAEMKSYAARTKMALWGVSHAASEFLVMQQDMAPWFKTRFSVKAHALPEAIWWR